jgi:hypothetical protein
MLTKVPGVERGSDAVGELGPFPSQRDRRFVLSRTLVKPPSGLVIGSGFPVLVTLGHLAFL